MPLCPVYYINMLLFGLLFPFVPSYHMLTPEVSEEKRKNWPDFIYSNPFLFRKTAFVLNLKVRVLREHLT